MLFIHYEVKKKGKSYHVLPFFFPPGVSLKCNKTVTFVAGETETLNCTVTYSKIENPKNCKCESCFWNDRNHSVPCSCGGLIQYGLDYATYYVLINISNVRENGNYSVIMRTDCGRATSSPIKVIMLGNVGRPDGITGPHDDETRPAILCGLFVIVIVSGILYFLFRTKRARQIMNSIKNKNKTEDYSDMDAAPESQGPLIA
ncbi:hypothetical protein FQN60_002670 [Etheostoma spectabile]|uniref:Immunoglobulin subtype domain-containing protein n=1 Tax=Etheostoma spectabile TaxID=54343 RepID=A0A5J5CK69_9PERO|nr:hypothetical protein FQN60_002670 [Etheostoma spectabile]